jgi:hypothetical protein
MPLRGGDHSSWDDRLQAVAPKEEKGLMQQIGD